MKLLLKNIGRNNFTGKIEIPDNSTPDEITESAYNAARVHLLSNNVDVSYDANTNEGFVFAGFRTVGEFSVVK